MGRVNEAYELRSGMRKTFSCTEQEFVAGLQFGRARGVHNIFNEPEFVEKDLPRFHPEKVVRTIPFKTRVSMGDRRPQTADRRPGRLTRFGRASFTAVYPERYG